MPASEPEPSSTRPAGVPPSSAELPTQGPPTPGSLPAQIGPYRILRRIGAGGMGVVFEAEQQHPKRAVALKVIRGGAFVDENRVRMFQREAQTLARLKHPAIAAIYESGRTETGEHFFAMELVRGETLDEYLDRRPASGTGELRHRLALFQKICDAVTYAHQRGVIHRDLKPGNILVLREEARAIASGNVPEIKILDFGLARITDTDVAVTTIVTDIGTVQGSLPYMSPEQVGGNPDEIDVRTDVYSLGILLYEMLTGVLPYTVDRASIPEAIRVICETVPSLPSRRLEKGRLDPDLDTIVMKALEKEPARRYQGVAALADDVHRYLTNQPILARPPSTMYQLRKTVARHRGAFAFAASVFLLLAGFAVTMTVQAARIAQERDRANREAETARQVSDFLVGIFQVSDPSESRGNTITAREILDRGAERIDRELEDQPPVQARLLDTMGAVYKSLGLFNQAELLLKRSLGIRRLQHGPESAEVSDALYNLADVYEEAGRYEEALDLVRQSLVIRERVLGPDHVATAWSLYELGAILSWLGRAKESQAALERARPIFERKLGPESIPVSWCLTDLANTYSSQLDFSEALPLYLRAYEIKKKALPEGHPDLAIAENNVGYAYVKLGNYSVAEPFIKQGIEISEKAYGPDHPLTANHLQTLGELYWRMGKNTEAQRILERALKIQETSVSSDAYSLGTTLIALAGALRDLGEVGRAESLYVRALTGMEKMLGPDNLELAECQTEYAKLFSRTGREAKAESLLVRVQSIRERAAVGSMEN